MAIPHGDVEMLQLATKMPENQGDCHATAPAGACRAQPPQSGGS